MSKRGALGVLIGAGGVAFTFRPRLLTRLLPEFPELYQRWLAAAMVAAVAAFALWREHQLYSGRVQDALGRGDTI
jgi:drug/metabolite transporter (DMT)-like permease